MDNKFTPGPWKVAAPLGEGDYAILSDKINAFGNFYVATIPNGSHSEATGTAALIAAAPDLLTALEAIFGDGKNPVFITTSQEQFARAAIAKAKGESK